MPNRIPRLYTSRPRSDQGSAEERLLSDPPARHDLAQVFRGRVEDVRPTVDHGHDRPRAGRLERFHTPSRSLADELGEPDDSHAEADRRWMRVPTDVGTGATCLAACDPDSPASAPA